MTEKVVVRDLRALDALVAERLFGWELDPDRRYGMPPGYHDKRNRPRVRDYSSKIADGWTVVERMRSHGAMGYSVELVSFNPVGGWDAVFGIHSANHVSAPVAICLCALRSKGVDVELQEGVADG